MRPNILIFCSWLNLDGYKGIFFREQAKIIDDVYEPILVTFNKQVVGLRGIFERKSLYSIIEKMSPENHVYLECRYIEFRFFPKKINAIIQNNTIHFLSNYLNKKDIKISLIHAQSLFDAGIWANRYCESHNIPYITTEHNPISIYKLTKENYKSIKKVLSQSQNNLVVSKDLIRQFAINGLFFDFTPIGNLVSEKVFFISKERQTKTIHFVTNGAYCSIKDQKTILDALLMIDKINQPITFSWIGFNAWGVDNYSEIQSLIDNYNFRNIAVKLIPLLNRHEVAKILNDADVFLLSSIAETFNVSVLEALACGKPVITTQCGGINEMITSENGFIIEIKGSNEMAIIMEGFINNKYVFNSEAISKKAISLFGEASFKKKLLSIYSNAISEYSDKLKKS
jgi:glycosyltransferase involved in cell wall biosynthesis